MKYYKGGEFPTQPGMYFVYGDGGTGKTSLVKQFRGHKIVFSFDLSANVLIGDKDTDLMVLERSDVPVIQKQVQGMIWRVIDKGDYDVVVLDNVTALQNLALENIDNAAKDNRQNYQKLQLWFRQLSQFLRESGKTVYATAHQIDLGDGHFEADMNQKTFNAFTSMFDLVGRIYLKDGQRMIDLDPESGDHAKNRIDERKLVKADELIPQLHEIKPTETKTKKEA
ncbi:AAA family ATPase [Secundilactobacillus similis]|nr:AAA family ATPase [Secundilactobacillus similis]